MLHAVLISARSVRNLVAENATPLQFMAGLEVVLNLLARMFPTGISSSRETGNRWPGAV